MRGLEPALVGLGGVQLAGERGAQRHGGQTGDDDDDDDGGGGEAHSGAPDRVVRFDIGLVGRSLHDHDPDERKRETSFYFFPKHILVFGSARKSWILFMASCVEGPLTLPNSRPLGWIGTQRKALLLAGWV